VTGSRGLLLLLFLTGLAVNVGSCVTTDWHYSEEK
jgi:hypothetical protein